MRRAEDALLLEDLLAGFVNSLEVAPCLLRLPDTEDMFELPGGGLLSSLPMFADNEIMDCYWRKIGGI